RSARASVADRSGPVRRRARRARRVGRVARAGPARARDPPADRRTGHVAPARRAVRGARRRAGRRPRARARRARAVVSGRDCDLLVFVTGTGTEIGKTWWGSALATELHARGVAVAARKPAQSFAPNDAHTDADVLARATGERPDDVCPPHRWYPVPLAPPMAAD